MLLIENKIEINAPKERVWQVTVDVEAWPKWSSAMKHIQREDAGEFKLGSSALIKQEGMPQTRWTVTDLSTGNHFTWKGKALGTDMTATHILTPANDCTVTSVLRIELEGLLITLLGPIINLLVAKSLKAENQGLKQFCESLKPLS
ncbi:MAG: hypothetical protein G3M70_02965 [Candidatus Nitronauta litoralis]|uniref:Polyketide cyclase / dehydrase and lipid transport n=1 Tax=Candidatus Nitronauta litoralis TaxID=2705533 RepID=A0A7T0FZI5_9BACT|nr:MAG: hypothetical protein G3M70_02965 [Candidatus Nitronauta litoralis]